MRTSQVTTHVLDATTGLPAAGVAVGLETAGGDQVAHSVTDDDGRAGDLGPPELAPGTYVLRFDTGAYFAAAGRATFYPEVLLTFTVGAGHAHVPLLLSPFAYSTYRGS